MDINPMDGKHFICDALLDFAARQLIPCPVIPITSTPQRVRLNPCYPNPFNPNTVVSFSLERPQKVDISIYDMRGRRVTVSRAR